MDNQLIELGAGAALIVLVMLMIPCSYRVWVGPTPADRLQAIDLLTTLLVGIIIVLGVLQSAEGFVDVGIALAAFEFIGTLAIARYISEGKVF